MADVAPSTGAEVVDASDVDALFQEEFAEMRTDEPGPARNESSHLPTPR